MRRTLFLLAVVFLLSSSPSTFSLERRVDDESNVADERAPEAGERLAFTYNGVEFAFRYCPVGSFAAGSPVSEEGRDDDEKLHEEPRVDAFWIQETETTQAQWDALGGKKRKECAFKGANLPVETINWGECLAFIWNLNEREIAPKGTLFSLPTEIEWEYACRAGTTTPFYWGNCLNGDVANCDGSLPYGATSKGNSLGKTCPVKSYDPNPWGLRDMCGNVAEWCWNRYGEYPDKIDESYEGTRYPLQGSIEVRGGGWQSPAKDCRSANREQFFASYRGGDVGFRLVLRLSGANDGRLARESTNDADDSCAWTDSPEAGARKSFTYRGVEFAFRYCPAGSFTMGAPLDEEGRYSREIPHEVTLTKGFWIQETETTQAQWDVLGVPKVRDCYFIGEDRPVENVSCDECDAFVSKLNELNLVPEGLKFSLPTEAQWEYACRAGTKTSYFWGNRLNGDKANCDGKKPFGTDEMGKKRAKTTRVGSFDANPWGIYDMHGNVSEWTSDFYGEYSSASVVDPIGSPSGDARMARGGSWLDTAKSCRSAFRGNCNPTLRFKYVGVRIILQ